MLVHTFATLVIQYSWKTPAQHDISQFLPMLPGIQGERIRQAFHAFGVDGDGYIKPEDFQHNVVETTKHELSDHLLAP
jgi:solute carrier family 25 (mitochondrial aspartate/glutamate transporter), member 12/13